MRNAVTDAPPWKLHACGHALIFAPKPAIDPFPFDRRVRCCGGFGLLLLLEYDRSDVGPYNEALYIPGRVSIRVSNAAIAGRPATARRGHSISWIVVSTRRSRDGGIANWGIPKQLGSVVHRALPGRGERYLVTTDTGERLLRIELRGGRLPGLPLVPASIAFNARLLPHTLIQSVAPTVFETRIEASGRVSAVRRARITSYAEQTAEIASRRVIATLRIPHVRLWFPSSTTYRQA